MKKLLFISFILLLSMSMAACGNSGDDSVTPDGNSGLSVDSVSGKRCLVLYCSRTGNTEEVARRISSVLGCDVLEVEPATPYEEDYDAMLDRAQEELTAIEDGNYPTIKTFKDNFDEYDLIFVGLRSGTVVWQLRCRLFCMNMLPSWRGNGLHYLQQVGVVGSRLQ